MSNSGLSIGDTKRNRAWSQQPGGRRDAAADRGHRCLRSVGEGRWAVGQWGQSGVGGAGAKGMASLGSSEAGK